MHGEHVEDHERHRRQRRVNRRAVGAFLFLQGLFERLDVFITAADVIDGGHGADKDFPRRKGGHETDADLPIKIQRITLKNAGSSVFRFNVDGLPAFNKELLDIEIGAKDSIYIFLEVTIQPNQPLSISPFVIQDQVQFITNGNNQSVLLEAWGQNANYIPSRYSNGRLALLSCDLQTETWDDPKPYVIYGVLFIDSCTLRIPAGARVYVHGGLVRTKNSVYDDGIIYVLDHGKLLIEGNAQKPVTMASDRLETELKDEWGAWSGIRINTNSTGNRISYADIKSAYVGVYADSASDVTIRNSKIYNTASSGILGVHASVTVENCLTYNNGSHGIQFAYGGVYRVDYTTIASYENDKEGLSMNNLFLRDPERMLYSYYPLNAFITNCIITGSGSDELDLTDFNGGKEPKGFNTVFSNCYVKAKELLTDKNYPKFFNDCPGCIKANANDTIFLKPANYDFRLDTNAVVNNKAKAIDRVKIDLPGVIRDVVKPDMGCYELR